LRDELAHAGVADSERAYNLTWQDYLNLESLIAVSQAIVAAALTREDSVGAHFRDDFPRAGPLEQSAYTVVRRTDDVMRVTQEAVAFTRVRPGETLLDE